MTRNEIITEIRKRVEENCTQVDMDARYSAMLDEVHAEALQGPFSHLSPSRVMQELAPTTYRCGFSDYLDAESEQVSDVNGNHYENSDIREQIAEFSDELSDKATEREEETADDVTARMFEIASEAGRLDFDDIRD